MRGGRIFHLPKRASAAGASGDHADLTNVTATQHHSNANDHANTLDHSNALDHSNVLDHSNALDHAESHTHASHSGIGADDHHAQAHVLADATALGGNHTISGGVAGYVLRALGGSTAKFMQLVHGDLGSVGVNDHHNQSHDLHSIADHADGLRATGVLAETAPRWFPFGTVSPFSSGQLVLESIWIPNATTITTINMIASTTGITQGSNNDGHWYFGIWDDDSGSTSGTARALLRATADQGTAAWAGNGAKSINLTSTYLTTRAGWFYVGAMIYPGTGGSPAVPTLVGWSSFTNAIGALSPARNGFSTASLTNGTPPDPAGAITGKATHMWVYLT